MDVNLNPLSAISETAQAAKGILGMFFPDKTQEERDKLAASLAMLNAQTDINKAEAQSSDPLQHWRGGLGWVCVAGYAWNFVIQPLALMIGDATGHHLTLHALDIAELSTLTLGMLGLGGLHVVERVRGAS
jgi:hypothetical protein